MAKCRVRKRRWGAWEASSPGGVYFADTWAEAFVVASIAAGWWREYEDRKAEAPKKRRWWQ